MAVRINLRKTDKPVLRTDSGLGGDRMAALSNMEAAPAPAVAPASADAAAEGAGVPGGEAGAVAEAAPQDMAASAVALRMVHAAAAEPPVPAAAPAADGEPVEEEASEALLKHSSKPAAMRAFAVIFKWGLLAAVLLGGLLYLMRGILFPVMEEMKKPKTAPVAVDKNASSLVQAVQQARVTVSKNDARVEYISEIMGEEKEKPKPVAVAPAPPELKPSIRPAAPGDRSRYRAAVDKLNITAVFDGATPRLFIDGIIVKVGDAVDRSLGLHFAGVDSAAHMVLFTNRENEVFRRPY